MRQAVVEVAGVVAAALWRDGFQRQARRNAWVAMVADNVRARARAEAEAALPYARAHGSRPEEEQRQEGQLSPA